MQQASALAAPEHREFQPFKGMASANDPHCRRKLFEMGSVSCVPSITSITNGW
jgi:hypothetical protein